MRTTKHHTALDPRLSKLNLGCGPFRKEGYTNIDLYHPSADMKLDLSIMPYPFDGSSKDEIYASGFLEHLDDIPRFLQEAHRILKPGGKLVIDKFPHFTSSGVYEDITHKHSCGWKTFLHFVKGTGESAANYYMKDVEFRKINQRIIFGKKFAIWNYLVEFIVNLHPVFAIIYENSPLRVFPAQEMRIVLTK